MAARAKYSIMVVSIPRLLGKKLVNCRKTGGNILEVISAPLIATAAAVATVYQNPVLGLVLVLVAWWHLGHILEAAPLSSESKPLLPMSSL
jgi:hypothetical protein